MRIVETDLTNWDTHSICSKITKPQYPAAICDNNDLDISAGPIVQHGPELSTQSEAVKVHAQRVPAQYSPHSIIDKLCRMEVPNRVAGFSHCLRCSAVLQSSLLSGEWAKYADSQAC